MHTKRFGTILLLLIFLVSQAFASFGSKPSINASIGGAFCIPTADYLKEYPGHPDVKMPNIRTSYYLGLDADIIDIAYKYNDFTFDVGAGLSYLYISSSIPYGVSILKAYSGLGFKAYVSTTYKHTFSASFAYKAYSCAYEGTKSNFYVRDFEITPSAVVASTGPMDLLVKLPITLSVKSDAITVRTSICIGIGFNSFKIKGDK
ncbi:MAG: hypothetical protein HUK23_07190 [Sphaerochaetaceae bacterium]|nr:hypothetical protein [Sphaerochaetaceae bacterium]